MEHAQYMPITLQHQHSHTFYSSSYEPSSQAQNYRPSTHDCANVKISNSRIQQYPLPTKLATPSTAESNYESGKTLPDPIKYSTPKTVAPSRQRTALACDKCRERKTKCSGGRPTCQRCTTRGLTCKYSNRESRLRGPSSASLRGSTSSLESLVGGTKLSSVKRESHRQIIDTEPCDPRTQPFCRVAPTGSTSHSLSLFSSPAIGHFSASEKSFPKETYSRLYIQRPHIWEGRRDIRIHVDSRTPVGMSHSDPLGLLRTPECPVGPDNCGKFPYKIPLMLEADFQPPGHLPLGFQQSCPPMDFQVWDYHSDSGSSGSRTSSSIGSSFLYSSASSENLTKPTSPHLSTVYHSRANLLVRSSGLPLSQTGSPMPNKNLRSPFNAQVVYPSPITPICVSTPQEGPGCTGHGGEDGIVSNGKGYCDFFLANLADGSGVLGVVEREYQNHDIGGLG